MQFSDQTNRQQGESFNKALEEIKSGNNTITASDKDFKVTAIFLKPDGFYEFDTRTGLTWNPPSPSENLHVALYVQDALDYRFVPYLDIFCQIYDKENNLIGEKIVPFNWDPHLYHYGVNWIIPNDDEYYLRVTIKAPTFIRHDENLGKRYLNDSSITFSPIEIKIT
jgi:hypothetical protein